MKKILILVCVLMIAAPLSAQRPDAPPFAQRGGYAVGTRELMLDAAERPLKVTVWYPTDDSAAQQTTYRDGLVVVEGRAIVDAAPSADAPFPLVVFSHGSGGARWQSIFLTEHLASYGFVVIAPDHPGNTVLDALQTPDAFGAGIIESFAYRPLDIIRVLDFAEALNAPAGDLAGVIDLEHIAAAGHSFGGFTVLAVAGGQTNFTALADWCSDAGEEASGIVCELDSNTQLIADLRGATLGADGLLPPTTDPRLDAFILMAPASGPTFDPASLAEIGLPGLILVGSADAVTPPERDAYLIFERLQAGEKYLADLQNGGHYLFVDECSELAVAFGLYPRCSDLVWDMARAHDLINHFATAFLLDVLKDEPALQETDFIGVEFRVR